MNKIQIFFLKRKVKALYLRREKIAACYDCGEGIMKYINPEYNRITIRLNTLYSKLRRIDSNAPDISF